MNVALNLCPDGSKINISINGTTLTATKTALNATIGDFSISVNSHDLSKPLPAQNAPEPTTILVLSGENPLHVVSGTPPYVTANITLGK